MAGITYLVLLQVLFLVFSSGMAVDAEVTSEVPTTVRSGRSAGYNCRKWFPAEDMKERCKVIDDACASLEEALNSIKERDVKQSIFQSGPDHKANSKAFKERMDCIKNFLNKIDSSQGFSGLMENFHIFGIPFSKMWAFWMLTDPFELA